MLLLGELKFDCVLGDSQKADDKLTRFTVIYCSNFRLVIGPFVNRHVIFTNNPWTSNQPRTSESLEDSPQDSSSGIGWP